MENNTEQSRLINLCQSTFNAKYIDQSTIFQGDGSIGNIIKFNLKDSDGVISCKFRGRHFGFAPVDDTECLVGFKNIKIPMIATLLDENHYNYEIVERAINEFFKLGEKYKLFKTLKKNKSLKIEDNLSMARRWDMDNLDALLSNCQTISNIQFSNFYKTENHKKTIRPKKLKGKNMTLYYKFVVKNGKLHPTAHIDYPVAPNVSIPFIFDIHPDSIEASNEKFTKYYNELDERLNKRINQILKKELGFNDKDISVLTIDDKLNYLIVAEMQEV